MRFREKYIGDRAFYRHLFSVALPILIQTALTNCVNLLDNVMVGKTGTDQMSGVAVVNTLFMVFELTVFGVLSGASIFGAQYYGSENREGHRRCFCFKLIYGMGICLLGLLIFGFFGRNLIGMYLHEGGQTGDPVQTLHYGLSYLHIIMISLPVFLLIQAYGSSLREMGQTVLPMWAGVAAILVNCALNYVLIFGKFGAPALGVEGAAIATVISRFVEAAIILIAVHRPNSRCGFAKGICRDLKVPWNLQKRIILKGSPLMINELCWSAGVATQMQCFSLRGLAVVAGMNICSTLSNVFSIFFIAIGSSVSIIVGQLLGAGKMEEAKDTDTKMIATSVFGCLIMSILLLITAPLFPAIYNTTQEVRSLATNLLRVQALLIPFQGFMHACYFTLRSGGRTVITLLFDSVFLWVIAIPLTYVLIRFTSLPVTQVYLLAGASELSKCALGLYLLKKGVWLQNIVGTADL